MTNSSDLEADLGARLGPDPETATRTYFGGAFDGQHWGGGGVP